MSTPKKSKTKKSQTPRPVQLEKILVPVDFSESSEKALTYGLALAAQFSARVALVHVVEPPFYPTELGYVPLEVETLNRGIQETAEKQMDRWAKEHLEEPGQTFVRVGHPYHEITQAAKEWEADLIVVSTHGYTGLKHVFLGSTAERIVRHAGCPVLVVRDKEKDFV